MIFDRLGNAPLYFGLGARLRKAFDYLASSDFATVPDGRVDLDGDALFALVQRYVTKPHDQGTWEAHRRYADVQYLAVGAEQVGYAGLHNLTLQQPYSEAGDVVLLEGQGGLLSLRSGDFAVFFPEDAHMPGLACGEPGHVLKVVVKALLPFEAPQPAINA